uniref:Myb-like DNA-binding domain containing protein, putative n=1 Tax=Theileria annulata TaxID=5874 RepID=A0A3B0MUD2_THEAN
MNDNKEISQLVGKDGARPSSNLDSCRLHSFYSNLPLYRKKYDWNIPKWTESDLVKLHKLVRTTVIFRLSHKIDELTDKLTYIENKKVSDILNLLSSRLLYLIYLNFDFSILARNLANLVRSDEYNEFLNGLHHSSVYKGFENIYLPNRPKFQGIDLSGFWDSIASSFNSDLKGTMATKLSTDCCIKFINSTSSGVLLTDVSPSDFQRIEQFLTQTHNSNKHVENSVYLGVSVYQYMKVFLHRARTRNWTSREDSILLDLVSSTTCPSDSSQTSGRISIPWRKISSKIPGKNPEQCRLRYRQISNRKISDSPFMKKDLFRLKILMSAFGRNWSRISELMPGRSARQCRDKVLECTRYTKDNAIESLEYFRNLLSEYSSVDSSEYTPNVSLERPMFVSRYWKHFDWLGIHLFKVLALTRNEHLLQILHEFYFSEEINRRINLSFKPDRAQYVTECTGVQIFSVSNFLQHIAVQQDDTNYEKVINITQSIVKLMLKRSAKGEQVNFESFDEPKEFEHLKKSLLNILKTLWP